MSVKADDLTGFLAVNGTAVKKLLRYKFPALGEADTDDVVAEATAKIWARRAQYSSKQGLFPLVYLTAKRAALDRFRERKQDQLVRQGIIEQLTAQPDESDARTTQLVVDLKQCVQELPDLDQKVLQASVMFPRSKHWAKDLAEQLDVTPGMLRVRRIRAIEKLKSKLKEKGYEIPGDTP